MKVDPFCVMNSCIEENVLMYVGVLIERVIRMLLEAEIACPFEKVTVELRVVGVELSNTLELLTSKGWDGGVICVTSEGKVKVKVDRAGMFNGQTKEMFMDVDVYTVKVEGVRVTGRFVMAV